MIKLNPYIKTLRRQELLRSNKRAQAIVAALKKDKPRDKEARNRLGKIRAISNRNLHKKRDAAPKADRKPKVVLTKEQKKEKKVASIAKRKAALKLKPKKPIAKKDYKSQWLKDFIKNLHK